jgi:hypothetical protein
MSTDVFEIRLGQNISVDYSDFDAGFLITYRKI